MIILGIDPGTGMTGFGVIEWRQQRARLLDGGVVRTKPGRNQAARLQVIYEAVEELISQHQPAAVAVEKLFFNTNITTAMTVSEARGAVLLAAARSDVAVYEYTPLQVKQAMTGYGRAAKSQIQAMVQTILNLDAAPKPDDCADALAVAITHAFSMNPTGYITQP